MLALSIFRAAAALVKLFLLGQVRIRLGWLVPNHEVGLPIGFGHLCFENLPFRHNDLIEHHI